MLNLRFNQKDEILWNPVPDALNPEKCCPGFQKRQEVSIRKECKYKFNWVLKMAIVVLMKFGKKSNVFQNSD